MRHFELTEDLITGMTDIDDQHRTLVDLANKVINPEAIEKSPALFTQALKYLSNYVLFHFAAEEQVMFANSYPHHEQHRKWHLHYKEEMFKLAQIEQTEGNVKDLRLKISFWVEDLLMDHIKVQDRELAAFLLKKGEGVKMGLPDVRTLKEMGAIPVDFEM